MDRTEVIAGVASELYATEKAVDIAIAQATSLVQAMIAGRSTLSLSAIVGNGSQVKTMEAIAALGVAREAIVAAHMEMSREHRKMGWGTYAAGPMDKPPEPAGVTQQLRVA